MTLRTYYPSFNVMDEVDAWDDHTQSIVSARLYEAPALQALSSREADMLQTICSILVSDDSAEVMEYVVHHFDHTLNSSPGEGQRKVGIPEGKTLIREGLQAMNQCARETYFKPFLELNSEQQQELIEKVSTDTAEPRSTWEGIPQQPFFQKLLSTAIEAYCSHPQVWSDIGYAGPAYPRGYVRTHPDQLDPWEAKTER